MKIGYARVSTVNQDLEVQKEELEAAGCERVYIEKVTGTSTAPRSELVAMIENVRSGDTVYVLKIDRLARSIIDLNNIVSELNDKGVNIKFLRDNLEFNVQHEGNSMQRLMFNILGSFAQFERDLIVERTSEGRQRAKKNGKHMGRVGKDEKSVRKALTLFDNREENGMSVNDIVKLTGVPRSTIYAKAKNK